MVGTQGFSRYSPSNQRGAPTGPLPSGAGLAANHPTLLEVMPSLAGSSMESVERGKTIFFPGDPAERVYLLRRGAVRLSRVYESGEEITVALLRENSLFGVLSLLTGQRSDRFYHAIAFTRVELVTAPATSVRRAIEQDASVGLLLLQGLSSRILQTETMIETLTHRDMSSRLVSFLLVLCRDFGVPGSEGITIDLRLSHQAIAEAIGSTRVTITRLLGDLRNDGLVQIDRKKITVFDPIALAKRFS
jgi:global nitrogen regulator NtcA